LRTNNHVDDLLRFVVRCYRSIREGGVLADSI
jgi:hypothetical protein